MDSRDNSVTFSTKLYNRIRHEFTENEAKVYVFHVCNEVDKPMYAFTINPHFGQPTQLADVQYNEKYDSIGFECLVPTVNRIFYDYGHPAFCSRKFRVIPRKGQDGTTMFNYYILKP
jgi:hypothetical protein